MHFTVLVLFFVGAEQIFALNIQEGNYYHHHPHHHHHHHHHHYAETAEELKLNISDLRNKIEQHDAVTFELGAPKYEILNPDDEPEIITQDHPHYEETLKRYGHLAVEMTADTDGKILPQQNDTSSFSDLTKYIMSKLKPLSQKLLQNIQFVFVKSNTANSSDIEIGDDNKIIQINETQLINNENVTEKYVEIVPSTTARTATTTPATIIPKIITTTTTTTTTTESNILNYDKNNMKKYNDTIIKNLKNFNNNKEIIETYTAASSQQHNKYIKFDKTKAYNYEVLPTAPEINRYVPKKIQRKFFTQHLKPKLNYLSSPKFERIHPYYKTSAISYRLRNPYRVKFFENPQSSPAEIYSNPYKRLLYPRSEYF